MKPVILTIKEADWESLRRHLFQADGLERQAFMELGLAAREKCFELLLHRLRPVRDQEYLKQTRYCVRPQAEAVVAAYDSFAQAGVPVHGHVHSHPFCSQAFFSPRDKMDFQEMGRGLKDLTRVLGWEEEAYCFQMVMGRHAAGFRGFLATAAGENLGELTQIRVIGHQGIRLYNLAAQTPAPFSEEDPRLERNLRWLGEEAQQRLRRTPLAICGLGGVGALVVANVRGLGLGEITLIDPDRVEMSNLNRLVGAGQEDLESYKVDVMRREIRRVRPETQVQALPCGVEDPRAHARLREADVILGALDGMGPRATLQILAARYLKPLFDLGSGILVDSDGKVHKMGSQIIVYILGGPCLACQGMDIFRPDSGLAGDLRKKTGYVAGTGLTPTSVVTINSVLAGWAVHLLIRYLTGVGGAFPRYTQVDQWAGTVKQLNFDRKPSCPICGQDGIEGKGDARGVDLFPAELEPGIVIEPMEPEDPNCAIS